MICVEVEKLVRLASKINKLKMKSYFTNSLPSQYIFPPAYFIITCNCKRNFLDVTFITLKMPSKLFKLQ